MAAEAAILGLWLWRSGRRLWGAAFVATALASSCGGTSHGFVRELSPRAVWWLWSATYVCLGVAHLLLLWHVVEIVAAATRTRTALRAALAVHFLVATAALLRLRSFRYAIMDYGLTLLVLAIVAAILAARGARAAAAWLSAGVAVSVVGAWVQSSTIHFGPGLNENDLFHLIQMVGLVLFFRGGKLLQAPGR
jgi:hypothetical protein